MRAYLNQERDIMANFTLTKPDYQDWIETQEYRGDELAAALEWNLSKDIEFTLDDVDWGEIEFPDWLLDVLKDPPHVPTIEDVTVRQYGGSGAFDAFMESFHNHLEVEYNLGRITGAEYATTWVQLVQIGIQTAVEFVLQRDKLRWDLILGMLNGWGTILNLYIAKIQAQIAYITAQCQLHQLRAQYCLTKLQLSVTDAQFAQTIEAMESQRANTLDTRLTDGKTIVGYVGKQKDMYTQQIASFKRNDEQKYIEQLVNLWVAEKTVDEGVLVPDAGTNANITSAMEGLRSNLSL